MAGSRQRDPIGVAPFWPRPQFSRGSSRSQQRRWGEEARIRERTNRSLRTLKDLASGELTDAVFLDGFSSPRSWSKATSSGQGVSERMRNLEEAAGGYPSRGDIDVARGRLVGRRRRTGGGGKQHSEPRSGGEVWPMTVTKLDLPASMTTGIPLETISPRAAHLFNNVERLMLDPAGLEQAALGARSYQDPALKKTGAMVELCARLWMGGVLTVVSNVLREVALFSVVKKVILTPDAPQKWDVVLRLIFDNREGNLMRREPPWAPLGGPRPLAAVDQSGVSLEETRFTAASGDVSNWYYRLMVPTQIAEHFVVPDVSVEQLRAYL